MICKNGNIKCDVCGKFIKLKDFLTNKAETIYVGAYLFLDESFDHIHKKCKN